MMNELKKFAITPENYKATFLKAKLMTKIMLIILMIVVSVVYAFSARKPIEKTLFGTRKTGELAVVDASVAGILGVVSVLIVIFLRKFHTGGIWHSIKSSKWVLLSVFFILALFGVAQEASGFNRWLAKGQIAKSEGIYASIDSGALTGSSNKFDMNILSSPQMRELTEEEKLQLKKELDLEDAGGDPFIKSVGYSALICVLIFFIIMTLRMLISSFVGAKTGKHNIRDILYTGETQKPVSSALWFLILEVGAMALLNGAGPLISAKLQGDHVQGPKKWIMPGIIAGTAVLLHIMIQWVGLWDSFTHMRGGGVSHIKAKAV